MLAARLEEWCDKNGTISHYQAAYRKNYGCEDHVFVLNSILQLDTSRKRNVYAMLLDVR